MKRATLIFILILLSVITSCTKNMQHDAVVIKGYDAHYCEENAPLSSFINQVEVIPLISNEESAVLANPQKIVQYKEHFYILDSNRLLCYDPSGAFVRFIGKQGHGHGEYINVTTFVIANDTIRLADTFKNTLMAYTLDGDFISEREAPEGVLSYVMDAEFETDNLLFMANYIYNDKNDIYTRWNTTTNEVSVVDNARVKTEGTLEFVGTHPFCNYNGDIRYILPFSDVIKSTNATNTICFQTAKRVLTDSELQDMTDFSIMAYSNHINDFIGFSNIFETDNYLLLTFSNLEYIVVDKRRNECFRSSYRYEEGHEAFPLLNILSSKENTLIGIIAMEEYSHLKSKIQSYIKATCSIDKGYAIILYHAK